MEIRAASNPIVARGGTLYVRDWPAGTNQLYRCDGIAGPGRAAQKLTSFPDGMSSFTLSPDGRRLLVGAGRGGNEQEQVYSIDVGGAGDALKADGGSNAGGAGASGNEPAVRGLLENPDAVFHVNTWLKDSSGFLYSANAESSADFYLYRYDFEPAPGAKPSTRLLAKPGTWSASDVTRDGKRALVAHVVSESNIELFELDTASGAVAPILVKSAQDAVPSGETSHTTAVAYLADENRVLCQSDAEGGTRRLWLFDLKTHAASRPLPALDRFELDQARTNDARDLCALVTNEDGYGVLHVYRLPEFEPVDLPPIERGVVEAGEMRGNTIVWTLSNARTPGLSFAYDVPVRGARDSNPPAAREITFADERGVDLSRFTLPELVRFKSFDGLEIPAFLYLPANYSRGTKIPFVDHFHGGPEGQHRPGFDRTVQALLAHGFGVIQPNVRGSTGYGRAYQMLDDYKNRWSSVKDGAEAARWLVKQGYSEPKKIAAYGGSYGGFMSVAVTIEGKDVIGAGVDVVGIVNMKTFLEQTKGYRRKLREAEYGPLSDAEFLASISPLTRADEINVPMLIAHGLNDPRVPVGEAMQLAVNLQRRGLDPELYFFPDEGHGFQKLENRKLFAERMVRFLERTLARPSS
jgi:dipeptidyl aminopeptidase/acylaminoacyl peptidase